ncbi:MAG TPA: Rid family hydrolase [Candidatus Acidoferrales bacterium]|nr:Rid family hydrolase [Candidatus Acidoferrales bacterium]
MEKKYFNPDGLWKPPIYTQVITTRGGALVTIAGQTAYDEEGKIADPTNLEAQIEKAYSNVEVALKAAGGGWSDVVKMVSYVVGYQPAHRTLVSQVRSRFFNGTPPATTLIGVQSLALPEVLYEVDVTAVIE